MKLTYKLSEIEQIATEILPLLTSKIVILEGSMGMGKTTLTKALVKALGIDDVAASPTFGFVNQYENEQVTAYHFDFYRIENEEEAFDIGFDEYLYSGDWCFIEWAEKVASFLPENIVKIRIEWLSDDVRSVEII